MKFATVVFSLNLMFLIMGILLGWGTLPLIFSGVGTLAGGLRLMEVNLSKKSVEARQSAREIMDSVAEIENRKNKTVYDCRNYEDMTLQLRFVEAGISERNDLPICDDNRCPLCKDERVRRENVARVQKAKADEARKVANAAMTEKQREHFENRSYEVSTPLAENLWKAYKDKYGCFGGMSYYDYLIEYRSLRSGGTDIMAVATDGKKPVELKKCLNCARLTDNRLVCRPCTMAAAQQIRSADAQAAALREKAKSEARRTIVLPGGMQIVRPAHVPSFAEPTVRYDNAGRGVGLEWDWSYEDGTSAGVFQAFDDEEFNVTGDDKSILTYRENPCSDAAGHELAICACDGDVWKGDEYWHEKVRERKREILKKYYRA